MEKRQYLIQIEGYRNDTARYRNFVDQNLIRNWVDESGGFTGQYAQFANGPYGQLLTGTMGVNPATYIDLIADGFGDDTMAPDRDSEGNIVPRAPAMKNNSSLTDYTRQFTSYVDEHGVIQPGLLVTTNPGGDRTGRSPAIGNTMVPTSSNEPVQAQGTLEQWKQIAMEQAAAQRDNAVDMAVQALLKAQQQADATYQEQRDQIERQQMQALDNSALYAATRGDRGGIGKSQYDFIQAQASANRQSVADAQMQLAKDTTQQIIKLRAQGEFEKADDMMQISQTYLLKLLEMEQWAAQYNLSVDQFRESIRQWEKEYEWKLANAMI